MTQSHLVCGTSALGEIFAESETLELYYSSSTFQEILECVSNFSHFYVKGLKRFQNFFILLHYGHLITVMGTSYNAFIISFLIAIF